MPEMRREIQFERLNFFIFQWIQMFPPGTPFTIGELWDAAGQARHTFSGQTLPEEFALARCHEYARNGFLEQLPDARFRPTENFTRANVEGFVRAISGNADRPMASGHLPVKEWDVFISHAGEDKTEVVEPLARALRERGLGVWYDRWILTVGDSLRRRIDDGLANSRYGVVVLSPSFFGKHWPERELDGLVQKEVDGKKVILPVWHKVTRDDVARYSLPLSDRYSASTAEGIDVVADRLLEAIVGVTTDRGSGALPVRPPSGDSVRQPGWIVLGGVPFETDPDYYAGPQIERRSSTHMTIGGGKTIQDFGNAVSAKPVRLRDGVTKLDQPIMHRLQELMIKGGSHLVTDWVGNEYQAFISDFSPRPSGPLAWAYEMSLQVVSVARLRGVPYVDPRRSR